MKESIDFAITYEKSFENLAHNCISSAQDKNIFIHLNLVDVTSKERGLTTKSWYECLRKKIVFAKQIFNSMEDGNILCVSDCDIFYVNSNKIAEYIQKIFKENEIDILGMCEVFEYFFHGTRKYINCGYFFIKKDPSTLNFFNSILEHDFHKFRLGEQEIINNIVIPKLNIKTDLLSPLTYPMGCYVDRALEYHKKNQLQQEKIVLMHTTCTDNKKEKIEQIDKLIDYYKMPKLNWENPELTKEEIVLYYNHKPL